MPPSPASFPCPVYFDRCQAFPPPRARRKPGRDAGLNRTAVRTAPGASAGPTAGPVRNIVPPLRGWHDGSHTSRALPRYKSRSWSSCLSLFALCARQCRGAMGMWRSALAGGRSARIIHGRHPGTQCAHSCPLRSGANPLIKVEGGDSRPAERRRDSSKACPCPTGPRDSSWPKRTCHEHTTTTDGKDEEMDGLACPSACHARGQIVCMASGSGWFSRAVILDPAP